MEFHSVCATELALELTLNSSSPISVKHGTTGYSNGAIETIQSVEPSLTLGLVGNHGGYDHHVVARQDSVVISGGGSSLSNRSVKREREGGSEESARVMSGTSVDDVEDDDDCVNGKKKLRLTKPQSALLEEAFKHHSSLSPKQKQELARELKLRPRQVEVWFQNRRARTKLKQTEMNFEHMKKFCEKLTDENRRLKKEVQELKALKASTQPFYMQLPATTLTICPSCERIGDTKSTPLVNNPFAMVANKPYYFNSFTNHPSAAC